MRLGDDDPANVLRVAATINLSSILESGGFRSLEGRPERLKKTNQNLMDCRIGIVEENRGFHGSAP